jgi:hypothetical protein
MTQPTRAEDDVILSPAHRAKIVRIIRDAIRRAEAQAAAVPQPDDQESIAEAA